MAKCLSGRRRLERRIAESPGDGAECPRVQDGQPIRETGIVSEFVYLFRTTAA